MQLSEFSFYISKASFDKATQERRWMAVASDTDLDLTEERMSIELFKSFIDKAKNDVRVPDAFASKFWYGGMPYISVSHYLDLDGKYAAGIVDDLYVDGDKLKAKGRFFNNGIGIKVFDSVCKSLYSETGDGFDQKIRISIGFIDYAHKHGEVLFQRKLLSDECPECKKGTKNKVYIDGQLVHLAVTRIPCNERTEFGLDLEEKSMTTRKQDAATIIGDDLAEEIEKEHVMVGKTEDSLVIKKKKEESEDEDKEESEATEEAKDEESMEDSDEEEKEVEDKDKKKVKKSEAIDELSFAEYQGKTLKFQEMLQEKLELVINKLDNSVELEQKVEPHPLDESIMNLKSLYNSAIETYDSEEDKLRHIQTGLDSVGEAILENIKSKSKAEVEQKSDAEVEVEKLIAKALSPIAEQLSKLSEQLSRTNDNQSVIKKSNYIPKPRSLTSGELVNKTEQYNDSPTPKLSALIRSGSAIPKTRL